MFELIVRRVLILIRVDREKLKQNSVKLVTAQVNV